MRACAVAVIIFSVTACRKMPSDEASVLRRWRMISWMFLRVICDEHAPWQGAPARSLGAP